MSPYTIFIYFMIYAFFGWCCETIYVSFGKRQFVNRGFLNGPICPIYGFGALLVLYILEPFIAYPLIIFILGMLATSLLEYFTSWLMELLFNIRWWDYSSYKYNIKGRVCLKNSLMFGVLGIFAVYFIHPAVQDVVAVFGEPTQMIIAGALLIILIIDSVISTLSIININKALQELDHLVQELYLNGEITRQKVSNKVKKSLLKLEKRQQHFRKAFPNLQHKRFRFDRSIIDDIVRRIKDINK